MAFFTWSDLLAPSPPTFVTGSPSGLIGRSIAQNMVSARLADPLRFISTPDYSGPGPTPIWSNPQAFWDEALGRVPVLSDSVPLTGMPVSGGFDAGGISTWYNLSTQQEIQDTGGTFDPTYTPLPTPMGFFPSGGSARLNTGVGGFQQWVIDAVDSEGDPIEVAISDSYGPTLWQPRGLQSVVVIPRSTGVPQPSTSLPETPATYTPTNTPVPLSPIIPALPGIFPTPIEIPFILPNPHEFGNRPIPIIPAPTVPERQRRALPPIFATPEGLQVGGGSQDDPVPWTPADIVPDVVEAIQEIVRQQTPAQTCPEPPDPCQPVDYARIQQSVVNVISRRVRLPGSSVPVSSGATAMGNAIQLAIPANAVAVSFTIDTTNFTGGATSGGLPNLDVYRTGWFGFRGAGSGLGLPERRYFSSFQGSIEVPLWATVFSATLIDGATGSFTVLTVPNIPAA